MKSTLETIPQREAYQTGVEVHDRSGLHMHSARVHIELAAPKFIEAAAEVVAGVRLFESCQSTGQGSKKSVQKKTTAHLTPQM